MWFSSLWHSSYDSSGLAQAKASQAQVKVIIRFQTAQIKYDLNISIVEL